MRRLNCFVQRRCVGQCPKLAESGRIRFNEERAALLGFTIKEPGKKIHLRRNGPVLLITKAISVGQRIHGYIQTKKNSSFSAGIIKKTHVAHITEPDSTLMEYHIYGDPARQGGFACLSSDGCAAPHTWQADRLHPSIQLMELDLDLRAEKPHFTIRSPVQEYRTEIPQAMLTEPVYMALTMWNHVNLRILSKSEFRKRCARDLSIPERKKKSPAVVAETDFTIGGRKMFI
eukprot:TRINITY_DN8862_c0_g1_i2.p1 TRINITY_DN8862_c0_g1~~TRINITY_DN8862_c0_g1_i2.p1  ORF type:complete len:231 (+),score=19.72 TRINITY_DN8862_c0_g1_i2:192-884(+)